MNTGKKEFNNALKVYAEKAVNVEKDEIIFVKCRE